MTIPSAMPRRRLAIPLALSLVGALALASASPYAVAAAIAAESGAGAAAARPAIASAPSAAGTATAAAGKLRRSAAPRRDSDPDVVTYGRRDDAVALAAALAERFQIDPDWTRAQLAQARYLPTVARLILPAPAGTAKNWAAYRARFVEPQRLATGLAFWNANTRWLDAAYERYGVPPEIVVGIIGVETFYGRINGGFRVLDALATLSLDFPTGRKDRSAFFRDELGQFLALAYRERIDPTDVKGSFAGAIGPGQFMPGSINRHAVDFDGDGRIDMVASVADVIGSVANYLARFGWQRDMPTHFAVRPPQDTVERALLLEPDILPSFTAAQMIEHGAELDAAGRSHGGLLALVELHNGDAAPSYAAGTQNFYAVTRYNWSSYYALAVIELGQAVAALRAAPR